MTSRQPSKAPPDHWWHRAGIIGGVVSAMVATFTLIVTSYVLHKQLREMHAQTQAMQGQLDAVNAQTAGIIFATRVSLERSRDGVWIKAMFQNIGIAPALNFRREREFYLASRDDEAKKHEMLAGGEAQRCLQTPLADEGEIIVKKSDDYMSQFDLSPEYAPPQLSSGDATLFVHLCYTYSSVGKVHHTAQCFLFNSHRQTAESFASCNQGNAFN